MFCEAFLCSIGPGTEVAAVDSGSHLGFGLKLWDACSSSFLLVLGNICAESVSFMNRVAAVVSEPHCS